MQLASHEKKIKTLSVYYVGGNLSLGAFLHYDLTIICSSIYRATSSPFSSSDYVLCPLSRVVELLQSTALALASALLCSSRAGSTNHRHETHLRMVAPLLPLAPPLKYHQSHRTSNRNYPTSNTSSPRQKFPCCDQLVSQLVSQKLAIQGDQTLSK